MQRDVQYNPRNNGDIADKASRHYNVGKATTNWPEAKYVLINSSDMRLLELVVADPLKQLAEETREPTEEAQQDIIMTRQLAERSTQDTAAFKVPMVSSQCQLTCMQP